MNTAENGDVCASCIASSFVEEPHEHPKASHAVSTQLDECNREECIRLRAENAALQDELLSARTENEKLTLQVSLKTAQVIELQQSVARISDICKVLSVFNSESLPLERLEVEGALLSNYISEIMILLPSAGNVTRTEATEPAQEKVKKVVRVETEEYNSSKEEPSEKNID